MCNCEFKCEMNLIVIHLTEIINYQFYGAQNQFPIKTNVFGFIIQEITLN